MNVQPDKTATERVFDDLCLPNDGESVPDPAATLIAHLEGPDGNLDALSCGRMLAGGSELAEAAVITALRRLRVPDDELNARASEVIDTVLASSLHVTGAEAAAILLSAAGVVRVFAYAGTSELSLCDAVRNTPGLSLVNGRGDKESAFMAAGGSLLRPNRTAAILHGARGLTNAAGGLADARRNEAGTVYLVGLPSTSSARFLPPHGETGLIETLGKFARWYWEAPAVPGEPDKHREAAVSYVRQMREAIAVAGRQPWGPVLFGVPQDIGEARWIPLSAFATVDPDPAPVIKVEPAAIELLRAATRPVFLVDDYALRSSGIRPALDRISRITGAAVLQVRYRRGPMLFERLQTSEVANFIGWLNQYSTAHMDLLSHADLLVTVEDRNIYRRVVGDLPSCRKIAVNSDPSKVIKNKYMGLDDVLLSGNPALVMDQLSAELSVESTKPAWFSDSIREANAVNPEPPSDAVRYGRAQVAATVTRILGSWTNPVLVDDSQMFGGLLSDHYDEFPSGLRVFGSHGGFVGGGLAYSIGLAAAEPHARVLFTLGDQAFTNSFQALVAAIQQKVSLLIIVCNNGGSVSLKKQANTSYGSLDRDYLANVRGFSYYQTAQALGVPAERVEVPVGASNDVIDFAVGQLTAAIERSASIAGPTLVELVLPSDPDAWRGIWLTQGFEQTPAVSVK